MAANLQVELEIDKLQKKITKLSKTLNKGLKPDVKAKRFMEITQYQQQVNVLMKQLTDNVENLYEKDYIKHAVPIKSNIATDETTAVLKATEDELVNTEVNSISGTEILFMDMNNRQQIKDDQETLKNTIMKSLNGQVETNKRKILIEKLDIISMNLNKLEAALGIG